MKRRGETEQGLSGREYDRQMMEAAENAFTDHEIRGRGEGRWMLQKRREDGSWDWNMAAEVVSLAGRLYVGGDVYPVIFGHDNGSARGKVAWLGGTRDVSYYVHQKACIGMGVGSALGVTDQYDFDVARWDMNQLINERLEDRELPSDVHDVLSMLDSVAEWDEDEDADGPLFPYLERELGEKWWPKLRVRLGDVTAADAAPICLVFKDELEKLAREELEKADPVCEALRDTIMFGLEEGHDLAVHYACDRVGRVDPDFMSERYDFGIVCHPRVYYAWGALRRLHELLLEEERQDERGTAREDTTVGV